MEIEKEKELEQAQGAGFEGDHVNGVIHSEVDLSEKDESSEGTLEDDHKQIDYSNYSKAQLTALITDLSKDDNIKKVDLILKEIKPFFDEIKEREKTEARLRFVQDGANPDDFEYRGDDLDTAFEANFKLIKDRRAQFLRQQENQKQDNLRRKIEIIEKLRELIDSPESSQQFEIFKELQKEWKSIGAVPGTQAKTLWANYHALVDRFYDHQNIYFELKELDRKKNLEAKLELCARAERLLAVEIINTAIRELNELHHEFKHTGPVPREDKEVVWQRFKAASDAIYARRDEYLSKMQQDLQVNFDEKLKLADEVQEFATYQSDRIKEWNEKTKIILDIQKRWEIVGGLPRAKAKEVNRKFWSAFKAFFNNKNNFFRKLDEEREQNLQRKQELIQKAIALKASHDWEKTSNELKSLQLKWKEIGPVPEKLREKIFKEFKDACDYFFEQRREQHGKLEQEQAANLQRKLELFSEIENHIQAGTATMDILTSLQERYTSIGFVPRNDMNSTKSRYGELCEKFIAAIPNLSDDEKSKIILTNELQDLKNDPMAERKLYQREQGIRKKIQKIENDIALWKNNLEFFSRSSNADSLRAEFNEKINDATDQLKQLKDQLKLLRTV
ncbi:MAG: DUF349 domain-containing protein [Cyclobacteriaceae bacterium]|nr:DUF349 domain-containing protein [Cyclobacteriaceae bacterium]